MNGYRSLIAGLEVVLLLFIVVLLWRNGEASFFPQPLRARGSLTVTEGGVKDVGFCGIAPSCQQIFPLRHYCCRGAFGLARARALRTLRLVLFGSRRVGDSTARTR